MPVFELAEAGFGVGLGAVGGDHLTGGPVVAVGEQDPLAEDLGFQGLAGLAVDSPAPPGRLVVILSARWPTSGSRGGTGGCRGVMVRTNNEDSSSQVTSTGRAIFVVTGQAAPCRNASHLLADQRPHPPNALPVN